MDIWNAGPRRIACTMLLAAVSAAGPGGCTAIGQPDAPLTTFEHTTVLDETPTSVGDGTTAVGPVTAIPSGFREALLSMNADVPTGAGVVTEIRVGQVADDFWSPWMPMIAWGAKVGPSEDSAMGFGAEEGARAGRVEIDAFVGRAAGGFDRVQYRFRGTSAEGRAIWIRRVAICTTRETGLTNWKTLEDANAAPRVAALTNLPLRTMDVPFRSQLNHRAELIGRLGSPTSVSMVLAYRGKPAELLDVASSAFDAEHGSYGNWPRNVQAAYVSGVKGYLTRVSSWREVESYVARGTPLVINVGTRGGDLPMTRDNVHDPMVLTGFAANGDVTVNDPAARNEREGRRVISRTDLERSWMCDAAGTAYVLGE